MPYLISDISDDTELLPVNAALSNPTYPLFYDLASETVKVLAGANTTEWQVARGVGNTQAVRHSRGTPLVANANPYSGGTGGVTVTGSQSGEVAAASGMQLLGAVSEGSPGVATQAGVSVQSVVARTVAQATLSLPGADQFTVIVMDSIYDPGGYYSANLPQNGVPGFLIPTGQGGLHRVWLATRLIKQNAITPPGNYRIFAAISFQGVTTGIPADLRDTKLIADNSEWGGSDSLYAYVVYVGQMDQGEEIYFYAKNDTGDVQNIEPGTCALIEKLS